MDTRLKNYSHLAVTKLIVFMLVVLCFTGILATFLNVAALESQGDFGIVAEQNYFASKSFMRESERILSDLTKVTGEYKNEKNILDGGTITEDELRGEAIPLFSEFMGSKTYNPNLSEEENYKIFKTVYADKISQVRDRMIKDDLREYHLLMQRLRGYKDVLYYASDGVNVYTNSTNTEKAHFKTYPSYMIFDKYERELHPSEVKDNKYLYPLTEQADQLDPEKSVVYIAFTERFLDPRIEEWKEAKVVVVNSLYKLAGLLPGLILSFISLVIITGRKSSKDQEVHLNAVDWLYNDVKFILCLMLITLWAAVVSSLNLKISQTMLLTLTIPIASAGLLLILSLVRHFKNGTIIKHTLIFTILYKIFKFVSDVYNNGSVAVKTVIIVIVYPILVAATLFMFPITLGVAAWLAFQRVRAFNTIKEGVEKIKAGDIHHTIEVKGNGEFGQLAANINSITEGLKEAVDNELKSERLKTELITNVSHDIRTPLTSIITYVDLLKKEKNPQKTEEYIEVLDQKSQRLKVLTDDLFEAAKATSGNIPVNFERINLVSLITQGLGELNDKIEALDLHFKLNHPGDNVYVSADGKLLWRSIENLLSNILKYALRGSRVYIDIENLGSEILLSIKNISAYELNISADELMERFTRGDESRTSQGSGLGLSIAKSLIEIQKGKFLIQVDGDLFKAMIYMPKANQ